MESSSPTLEARDGGEEEEEEEEREGQKAEGEGEGDESGARRLVAAAASPPSPRKKIYSRVGKSCIWVAFSRPTTVRCYRPNQALYRSS